MDSENSLITAFLTHLSENEDKDTIQFSKQRLQKSYSTFLKTIEKTKKNSLSFAMLQLRLKDEGSITSSGRDHLRFISGLHGQSTSKEVEVPQFTSSMPQFASHTRFFLVGSESFEDVKESTESGRLLIPSMHQNTLNEAFRGCEQVVLLVCVRFGNRLRGFCTMDSLVSKVADLQQEWSANLKADDGVCSVSWEKLGDYPIPEGIQIGSEMDPQQARNQCQAFYFGRQSSVGEFKSPESGITDTTTFTEEQTKSKGVNLATPLIEAFSRCNEDTSENEEEFRRRSMDKLAAAAHYKMPPRKTGVVVKFSQQKGYGFIRPDFDYLHGRQLPDIFVHRTSIVSSNKVPNLRVGQKTEYDVTLDPRTGKPHAVNVTGPSRVPLDELKIPAPPLLERPPLYSHSSRNIKSGKSWSGVRRMVPQHMNSAPMKAVQSHPAHAQKESNQGWKAPMQQRTNKWETEKKDNRFLPKEMNMTVTIDNDLPSNVSRYQHRQTDMSTRSQTHWGQPQFSHDYHGHYDTHRHGGYKQQNEVRTMTSNDYNGRDWKVTSPAREVPNESYDGYKREYWRYDQEVPQYDGGDYRQMGYNDYRYQREYRPQQNW